MWPKIIAAWGSFFFGRHIKLSDSLRLQAIASSSEQPFWGQEVSTVREAEPAASCWITVWREVLGHHMLARSGEPLGVGILFQE